MNPRDGVGPKLEEVEDRIVAASGALRDAITGAANCADAETIRALAQALVLTDVALIEVANKRSEELS